MFKCCICNSLCQVNLPWPHQVHKKEKRKTQAKSKAAGEQLPHGAGLPKPKRKHNDRGTQWQSVRFSQSKSLSLFARQRSEECLKRISSKGSGSILQPSSNSQNVLRCIGGRIARWMGKQIRHGDGMRRLWRMMPITDQSLGAKHDVSPQGFTQSGRRRMQEVLMRSKP